MCIRQRKAPESATTPASPGSPRRAVTSLTSSAPRARARRATSDFEVSIETGTSPASPSSTGTTRRSSSSASTPSDPGRVDSPPTSTIAAPSAAMRRAEAIASAGSRLTPPSENESGVTLTTPITLGLGNRSSTAFIKAVFQAARCRPDGLCRCCGLRRSRAGRLRLPVAVESALHLHPPDDRPDDRDQVPETRPAGNRLLTAIRGVHLAHFAPREERDRDSDDDRDQQRDPAADSALRVLLELVEGHERPVQAVDPERDDENQDSEADPAWLPKRSVVAHSVSSRVDDRRTQPRTVRAVNLAVAAETVRVP